MSTTGDDELNAKLEQTGVQKVREKLETGKYGAGKRQQVEHWLAEKDRAAERRDIDRMYNLKKDSNKIASRSNFIAWVAVFISLSALIVSVIAMLVSTAE
ncbi:MAG: hypothetical protein CMF50_03740 [Legionellales bacterium]|nr:hypothetical protein [Legionellales bacterium]